MLHRSGLNFPPKVVLDLFVTADTNHDGVIEYDEFVPVSAQEHRVGALCGCTMWVRHELLSATVLWR